VTIFSISMLGWSDAKDCQTPLADPRQEDCGQQFSQEVGDGYGSFLGGVARVG
jgi:hypothetical protein